MTQTPHSSGRMNLEHIGRHARCSLARKEKDRKWRWKCKSRYAGTARNNREGGNDGVRDVRRVIENAIYEAWSSNSSWPLSGCIEGDRNNQMLVWKRSQRSTDWVPLCISQKSPFKQQMNAWLLELFLQRFLMANIYLSQTKTTCLPLKL